MNAKPDLIFLKGNFDDQKIWGGSKLKSYGYEGTQDKIGELYLISALKDKPSFILNKEVVEKNLYDFFINNRDWFNNWEKDYPLLSKLIDANDDLSVQVHPNDEYARINFNKFGKTECWYIIETKKNNEIVYGLTTNDLNVIKKCIEQNKWNEVLNLVPINNNDVIFIPAGTVHAIKSGTFLFEIQQSSDLTFRLYDYDRVDNNGDRRKLHIDDALSCINLNIKINKTRVSNNLMIYCPYFRTEIYDINGKKEFKFSDVYWVELVILEDHINDTYINDFKLKKGISVLIKENISFTIKGNLKIAITYILKKQNHI